MRALLLVSALAAFAARTGFAAPAKPAKPAVDGVSGATHKVEASSGTAKAKGGKDVPLKEDPLLKKLRKPLADYIAEGSRDNGGFYVVEDPESDDPWELELKRIGLGRVRRPSPQEAIVRVEFIRRNSPYFEEKDFPVLVDFTLAEKGGAWAVTDDVVASVEGRDRFTYDSDDRRLPVDSDKDKEDEDDGLGNGPGLSKPENP